MKTYSNSRLSSESTVIQIVTSPLDMVFTFVWGSFLQRWRSDRS